MKPSTLPTEQGLLIPEVLDEWLSHGLSTSPAARGEAEAGVRMAYSQARLDEPCHFIWLDSPFQGAIAAAMFEDLVDPESHVRARIRDLAWVEVRASLRGRIWEQALAGLWSTVEEQVGNQVWRHLLDQLDQGQDENVCDASSAVREVKQEVEKQLGKSTPALTATISRRMIRVQALRAIYGQHDAADLSYFDFVRRCGVDGPERLDGISTVAKNAGWWWPLGEVVVITERPQTLNLDLGGRIHSEDGLSIEYPDGWGVEAIHGVRIAGEVPAEAVSLSQSPV